MKLFQVRMTWKGSSAPQFLNRHFYQVDVYPEPGYPMGRKGKVFADTWRQIPDNMKPKYDGMLVIEGDVLIDPHDYKQMLKSIESDVNAVWTAPVKVWPITSKFDDWFWCHWATMPSQTLDEYPLRFGYNFTYLPTKLIELAIDAGWENWDYWNDDSEMPIVAMKNQIKVKVPEDCYPKHLHY